MKTVISGIVFAMMAITLTQALTVRSGQRDSGRIGPPSLHGFPGYGPFNPKATPIRFPRSPQEGGAVTGTVVQPLDGPERQPSITVDYDHKIYEGEYGDVSVTRGVAKNPGHRMEANVGI